MYFPKIKTYITLNSYLNFRFKNVEYLNEGGFGTIYKAIWVKNNGNKYKDNEDDEDNEDDKDDEDDEEGEDDEDDEEGEDDEEYKEYKEDEEDEEVILKCCKKLNENLNEFLKEWKYHTSVLSSNDIINFHGFTEDPNTSKYMVVMDYANKGSLRENLTSIVKNNWNQKLYMLYEIISGLKVKGVFENWIIRPYKNEVSKELKSNIMEFINAPIGHNNLTTKSHPKACFTSRLLDFTSKKLNEILESENLQAYHKSHSDLNDCVIKDLRSLDENINKKLNEILESEDLHASVKANEINEMLVSEDLNNYIIKDLGSLDIKKADEN
ncbi:uncharacterized protein OCT59_027537 [Rhizophagus irregularis]|uniref:uncharacterized protein n=1 Tax=Rhizophagus irregularis TaxID=588596 RepID=UPI00332E8E33|nr:hypothetical protein OCT59_027537 [Rhizophagus irregularis]